MRGIKYRSFEDARKFVRKLELKGQIHWKQYCKSGRKPDDIPSNPNRTYTRLGGWKGWGDFLGTGRLSTNEQSKLWLPFDEARKFTIELGIKTQKEWKQYWKTHKRPNDIPAYPHDAYKKQGTWTTWGDFVGTGYIAKMYREFKPFKEVREFARGLKFDSSTEWEQYWKTHKRPADIPGHLHDVYKKEWKGWGDFLGTGRIANKEKRKRLLSAKEARIAIKKIAKEVFGGKPFTPQDWKKAFDEGKIPKNLPKYLNAVYNPNSKDNKRRKKK